MLTRQYHKIVISVVLLLLAVVGLVVRYDLAIPAFQPIIPQTAVAVTVVPVSLINKPIQLVRVGTVGQSATIAVNTEYTGQLSEIYVTEGQSVKAGQSLFKLEALPAGHKFADTIPIKQSNGASPQLQESYDNALKKFNSYQNLYTIGGISRREFENAAASLKEAQDRLAGSRNDSAANSTSAVLRGSAVIQAPTDGIVTGLSATQGRAVQAGQQLLALGSGQEMEVLLQLEQSDLYLLPLGTPVLIEASGQFIAGQVSRIYPQVEEQQIAYFLAHIKLVGNSDALPKPGVAVNAHMDSGQSSTVRAVARTTVFQDTQG
ncbi:MAG: efflux RND transporter periplasmic adaptor subunit, partial [Sporomusa sp.]